MAFITYTLSHPKPHHFSPPCRARLCLARPELVYPRTVSNTSTFLNFGHYISKPNKLFLNNNFFVHFHNNANRTVPATVRAALVEAVDPTEPAEAANFNRILLSDVVVKRRRRLFSGRKWNSHDLLNAGFILAMHCLCLFAPFQFSWSAVVVALVTYVVAGLFGITLSYHRNLEHRSFKVPKLLEYFFAYCGVLALQRDPIDWVSTHRYHHQFVDSERDPHSPTEGFWFSHINWLFDKNYLNEKCGGQNNVGDLKKQPFYRFLQRTLVFHVIAFGVLLYALGAFPYLVWGMAWKIALICKN